MRVERPWPRLPREAVAARSLAVLKARLDGALSMLISLKVPSNPSYSMIQELSPRGVSPASPVLSAAVSLPGAARDGVSRGAAFGFLPRAACGPCPRAICGRPEGRGAVSWLSLCWRNAGCGDGLNSQS